MRHPLLAVALVVCALGASAAPVKRKSRTSPTRPTKAAPAATPAPGATPATAAKEPVPQELAPEPLVQAEPDASRPAPAERRPWLHLGARGGVTAPAEFLRPGWHAGLDLTAALPWLEGRLLGALGAGVLRASGSGTALIPGRGYDPAFLQDRLAFALELRGEYVAWRAGPHSFSAGLSYQLVLVRDAFQALGASTVEQGPGHAVTAAITYRMGLGPGRAGVSLQGGTGTAASGPLSSHGAPGLAALALTLSYELPLLHEETPR